MDFRSAINVVQIIFATLLIVLVLLQTKGSGFTGMFGSDSTSVYHTRRGVEKRLFQMTIAMSILFFVTALINSLKF